MSYFRFQSLGLFIWRYLLTQVSFSMMISSTWNSLTTKHSCYSLIAPIGSRRSSRRWYNLLLSITMNPLIWVCPTLLYFTCGCVTLSHFYFIEPTKITYKQSIDQWEAVCDLCSSKAMIFNVKLLNYV